MNLLESLVSDKSILFLTTHEYSQAPSISLPFSQAANISSLPLQNRQFAEKLSEAGANVKFSSWRFPAAGSTRATLCRFDIISFLCCGNYSEDVDAFYRFLNGTLIPLQEMCPRMCIINDPRVVLWNADRNYLYDLEAAGFRITRTTFLERGALNIDVETFKMAIASFAGKENAPVMIRPAISAPGAESFLVQDPARPRDIDASHIRDLLTHPSSIGSILIQDFEPTVCIIGEYSLVYVYEDFSHAVLKRPKENGTEDHINGNYRARSEELGQDQLPKGALECGQRLWGWLEEKFGRGAIGYLRLDGVVGKIEGDFILGGVELIEPEVWLTKGNREERILRFVRGLVGDEGGNRANR